MSSSEASPVVGGLSASSDSPDSNHGRATHRPVVVGYEDGLAGTAALLVALNEAQTRPAPLLIVHGLTGVERPPFYGADSADDTSRRAVTRKIMRRIDELSPEPRGVDVSVEIVATWVARELIRASAGAQLLVLGVTTKHALAAAAFDTVPHEVTRRAECPVMVVPAHSEAEQPRVIVCGVDRTPGSADALRWAANEAARRGVTLLAIEERSDGDHDESDSSLSDWVRAQHPDAETTIVCQVEAARHPAQALLAAAEQRNGLLVVGRSDHRGAKGLRSVARKVSAQTSVPTVIVPPHPEAI
jgi:nucleotide-binding universal stress UspA family protein